MTIIMNNIVPVPKNWKIQSAQKKMPIDFFSDDEIFAMQSWIQGKIQQNKKRASYHKRYFLLFKTLLWTGARIDEALAIRPIDVHFDINTIDLITLKKSRPVIRTIPLHRELKDAFMTYFIDLKIDPKSQERIFPMRRQAVDLYFKRMQRDLGFRIHAHKFRHTFGVKAIINHVPLSVLQEWLGHSSIFTTSIYTQITGMDTSQFMNQMK
jgi:integrase